jgi:integrase/recombinase XerD
MGFSCKIMLADYKRADGTYSVILQAIMDERRAVVSLGFTLKPDQFDARRQHVKDNHRNAKDFNKEILIAVARAHQIASNFRQENKGLTPDIFRKEFKEPSGIMDFIKFIKLEVELKRPTIAENTYKQHWVVIHKLEKFKKRIPFNAISVELIQQYKNVLLKTNGKATANKNLKILKQYLKEARNKGMVFKDPFQVIKINTFKSNRLGLSQQELDKIIAYYDSPTCKPKHKKLLRYFLFSCYTGLRISDICIITWNNVHDDLLIFTPQKTKYKNLTVTVPLRPIDKKYLPDVRRLGEPIFETFADPVSNRYVKEVAELLGIKKTITYHTSRHTFGSLFAEGGNIVALQKMMGHSDIKTTMEYVHTSAKNLIDAKTERFG